MQPTIFFYDVRSALPDGSPTSPNTWRARLVLNFKRLPYQTVWIDSPDIGKVFEEAGIPPLDYYRSGKPHYTVPGLVDRTNPDAPVRLCDSFPIIQYLERTYFDPSRPLYPPGTGPLQALAHHFIVTSLSPLLFPLYIVGMYKAQTPRSGAAFRFAYERRTGRRVEELGVEGDERRVKWEEVRGVLGVVEGFMVKNGDPKRMNGNGIRQEIGDSSANGNGKEREPRFFLGDEFSFVDVAIVAMLKSLHNCLGEEAERELGGANGGRWTRLMRDAEVYMELK